MSENPQDLKSKIFETAMALFCQYGYEEVEMRQIAANCNIAVGTLYNYYANKSQLYTDIFITGWGKTLDMLDDIASDELTSEEKTDRYLTALYDNIIRHRGLMDVIIKSGRCEIHKSPEITEFKKALMSKINMLLGDLPKAEGLTEDGNVGDKIGLITIISTVVLAESFPDDQEKNIRCLKTMIKGFIK